MGAYYYGEMRRWEQLARNLYGSSETYSLQSLEFREEEEIGCGGCGNIYKGTLRRSCGIRRLYRGTSQSLPSLDHYDQEEEEDLARNRPEFVIAVAVKRIRVSDDEISDLMGEASNVRAVKDARNVAGVYGVTYDRRSQSTCIVMELVDGPDLNHFLRSGKAMTRCSWCWWKTKLEIFMELVIGLSMCHKRGIYHGDLKGKNRFVVPKLIDFGFSFRRRDVEYLKSLGGSPFWVAPELDDAVDEIPQEVLDNPYPSDVYALGMVLVELVLDGEIPEEMGLSLRTRKYLGGSPVELELPAGMEDANAAFNELFTMVEECCTVKRKDRISLEQCLLRVQAGYSQLVTARCKVDSHFLEEPDSTFVRSQQYTEITRILRSHNIPDAVSQQPTKNMMIDIQGKLLVHMFCELDFEEGVEFIVDKGAWNFQPERDVPVMARICVQEGSSSTLSFLGRRWPHIVLQEEWLMHDACERDSLEVLRVLVEEIKMDCDTWSRIGYLKPFHKLAFQGKVEMMKLLLKNMGDNYINTTAFETSSTPLNYAIKGDKLEAVLFLLEKDADMEDNGTDFLQKLLLFAIRQGSLKVATYFLEISYFLFTNNHMNTISPNVLRRFQDHRFDCLVFFGAEYNRYEDVLPILRRHLVESERRGMEPLEFSCSANSPDDLMFKMIASICGGWKFKVFSPVVDMFWRNLAGHGNREMAAYALEKLGKEKLKYFLDSAVKQENLELVEFLRSYKETEEDESGGKDNDEVDEQENGEDTAEDTARKMDEDTAEDVKQQVIESDWSEEEKKRGLILKLCYAVAKGNPRLVQRKIKALVPKEMVDAVEKLQIADKNTIRLVNEIQNILEEAGLWTAFLRDLLTTYAGLGDLEVVEYLLARGVPVDGPEYAVGWLCFTPLGEAVSRNRIEVAKRILEAGADPNARNKAGYTYMDRALGNAKLVKLLVKSGFDTGRRNRDNETYMDLIVNRQKLAKTLWRA